MPQLDPDRDIRQSVYTAYANAVAPTKENIEFLFRRLLASRQQFVRLPSEQMEPIEAELKTHREAILTLCRRTDDRDNVADLFTEIQRPDLGEFFLDCLFQLSGEKAAATIAKVAMEENDALGNICSCTTRLRCFTFSHSHLWNMTFHKHQDVRRSICPIRKLVA